MVVIADGLERHPFKLRQKRLTLILAGGIDEFGDQAAESHP